MLPTLSHDGYPAAVGPEDAPARLRFRGCAVGVGKSMVRGACPNPKLCPGDGEERKAVLSERCQSKQVYQSETHFSPLGMNRPTDRRPSAERMQLSILRRWRHDDKLSRFERMSRPCC